jgi:hypothetical protein
MWLIGSFGYGDQDEGGEEALAENCFCVEDEEALIGSCWCGDEEALVESYR